VSGALGLQQPEPKWFDPARLDSVKARSHAADIRRAGVGRAGVTLTTCWLLALTVE
jgi:hypothetical protein